jgi:hypothetical protein
MPSPKLGGEHTDNVGKIFGALMLAVEHQARGKDVQVLAENFCEMINLFTVSEIGQIQKKDPKFFNFLQIIFHAIKTSNSQDCKAFVEVCQNKLRATSVLKYSGPPVLMAGGGIQQGGGVGGKLTLCALLLWMITCVDLMANPGNAVTASLLTSLVVKLTFGKLSFLSDFLKLTPKLEQFPEKYVNPSLGAVTYVSATQGAFGAAYERLAERAKALAADREQLELTKASADHIVEGGMGNLVRCAKTGTCTNPVDSLVGTTLAPFRAAQESRPKISAEEVVKSGALQRAESELRKQSGKWAWGTRNETLIRILQANVTGLRAEIQALHNVSGIVASLPTLKDRSAVGNMLKAASKAIIEQVRDGNAKLPTSMRLANKPNSKPYGNQQVAIQQSYKAGTQLTVAGLEAAGIAPIKVDVQTLADSHPGAELDVVAIHAVGQVNDILRRAQQTVGALDTTVDASKIKQLIEKEFKAVTSSAKPQSFFGLVPAFGFNKPAPSKTSSAAEDIVVSMALSAAAEAADANARELEANAAQQLGELFDANVQKDLLEALRKITDQLVTLDYPGGRERAEAAAQEAMIVSKLFGMIPNTQTMEYARTILLCNTGGPCKTDTVANLQDKADLIREIKNWGLLQRFNHVKYNIMFALMSMLSLGGIADALLLTVVGIAGLPGRWATWGVEKEQAKQSIQLRALTAEAKRKEEVLRALHEEKQKLLSRPLDHVAIDRLREITILEDIIHGRRRARSGSRTPPGAPLALGAPAPLALGAPAPRRAPSPPSRAPSPPRGAPSPPRGRSPGTGQSPRRRAGSGSPPNALAAARAVGSLQPVAGLTAAQLAASRTRRFGSQRAGSRKMKRRGSKNTRRR